MHVRRTILLVAAVVLASRASAEGSSTGAQEPPPGSQGRTAQGAEKARELGQRGADAVRKGASTAREKVSQGGQAAAAKVVGTKTVTGKVVGTTQDQVTVRKGDGTELSLRVTDATKVTLGGDAGSPRSLREGDEVRASYAQSGGSATAMEIEVTRTPPSKRKPASKAARTGATGPGSASGSTSR